VYLLTPFVDGGELFDWVYKNGAPTEDVVKPLFRQLVQAVRVSRKTIRLTCSRNSESSLLARGLAPNYSERILYWAGAITRQPDSAEILPRVNPSK